MCFANANDIQLKLSLYTCRNAGDGLYEMYCTLSIDSSILRNSTIQGIPYKYLIYSKRGDIKQPYEFIDASGGGDIVNRCLLICTEDLQLRGMVFL